MGDWLSENLDSLRKTDPEFASRLEQTEPHPGMAWSDSQDPYRPSAVLHSPTALGGPSQRTTLASRYSPADEADRLAENADLDQHAAIVLTGFGLGYHVRRLARRVEGKGLLIVYEPDAALLRCVLEKLDCRDLLEHPDVILLVGDVDDSMLTRRLDAYASIITQGVQFISFPPTRRLHGERLKQFSDQFTRLVAYCRTNMATTLVNAAVTCRNLTHNLGQYMAGSSVTELNGIAGGYPAVVVSAGPSLARNIHLLAQPGMRDRVVIIAVQTVLKTLLDHGIRPHFVTALDYHEISKRFYEQLPDDLSDVTLVAEPKANKTIIDSYPGPVRVVQNRFLDVLLGPLARPMDRLPAGSTVAHLSFYLAQHLGCDPIMLVGQDLGFSDGLYYSPGTPIHDVWACELNPFNTLEMMEWKRIARHKGHLRRRQDVNGRPIYTDEQMLTYLAQFERDFANAHQTVIDATEGGMPKEHTERMTLSEALQQHGTRRLPPLPTPPMTLDRGRLDAAADHLRHRIEQVREFRTVSRKTESLLKKMQRDQGDDRKMNAHFEKLEKHRKKVNELTEAFALVSELNQIGVFKRNRADRAIRVNDQLDHYERQARQLERDLENVQWLIDSATETMDIFREALQRIEDQLESDRVTDQPMHATAGGAA